VRDAERLVVDAMQRMADRIDVRWMPLRSACFHIQKSAFQIAEWRRAAVPHDFPLR
jgi:hypothetical protein